MLQTGAAPNFFEALSSLEPKALYLTERPDLEQNGRTQR